MKLQERFLPPRSIRRLIWTIGLVGGLAWEGIKSKLRKEPLPVTFTNRDIEESMALSIDRYRWTRGGEA